VSEVEPGGFAGAENCVLWRARQDLGALSRGSGTGRHVSARGSVNQGVEVKQAAPALGISGADKANRKSNRLWASKANWFIAEGMRISEKGDRSPGHSEMALGEDFSIVTEITRIFGFGKCREYQRWNITRRLKFWKAQDAIGPAKAKVREQFDALRNKAMAETRTARRTRSRRRRNRFAWIPQTGRWNQPDVAPGGASANSTSAAL